MSDKNELKSGWWRCDCIVPCKCGNTNTTLKIHPPNEKICETCGKENPDPEFEEEEIYHVYRSIRKNRESKLELNSNIGEDLPSSLPKGDVVNAWNS